MTVNASPATVTEERKNGHVYYFDYLRAIAAFCVVYMHVAASPLRNPITTGWHLNNIAVSFSFCAVPLFFMMSGYLILTSAKSADVSVLLKKRMPHLVVPLAFWTVAYVLFDNYVAGTFNASSAKELLRNCLSNPTEVHLWYMYTLIAIYALSPLLYGGIQSLSKKAKIYIFTLIGAALVLTMVNQVLSAFSVKTFEIDLLSKMLIFGGDLLIFVLGYFLGTTKVKIPNLVLILFTLSMLAAVVLGTYYVYAKSGEFNQLFQVQHYGFEVGLAAGIFMLFKQNFNKPPKVLKHIPVVPLSMSIYFSHLIFIYYSYRHEIRNTGFSSTVVMTLVIFAVSYLFSKTAATIPGVCYAVTGMRFKDACSSCNWIYTFEKIKKFFSKKSSE